MTPTDGVEPPLARLLAGVRKFRREVFPQHRELYEQVMRKAQRPHTLFITCADSRIDPEKLTQSGPGQLFVARNIGNLVPAYGELLGGVSAVIEYAVAALEVQQIVICGHSGCGAMKGLVNPESVEGMPTVRGWLRNAEAALSVVEARGTATTKDEAVDQLVHENVRLQLAHTRSHPSVARRLEQGTLGLYGWVYEIDTGRVEMYDEKTEKYVTVQE